MRIAMAFVDLTDWLRSKPRFVLTTEKEHWRLAEVRASRLLGPYLKTFGPRFTDVTEAAAFLKKLQSGEKR